MEKPFFKIKKLNEKAVIPSKKPEDAGYDIYGIFEEDFILLEPGDIKLISTGFCMEIPENWVFYIAERGSTGSKGLSKRMGVVDSGYRGELFIGINNTSNKYVLFTNDNGASLANYMEENTLTSEDVTVYPQSKAIAQGILLYCPHIEVEEVEELNSSERGSGALGSSGK